MGFGGREADGGAGRTDNRVTSVRQGYGHFSFEGRSTTIWSQSSGFTRTGLTLTAKPGRHTRTTSVLDFLTPPLVCIYLLSYSRY